MNTMNRTRRGAASQPCCLAGQSGLSLIELMVGIAISLVILVAMVALFVNTSRSNRELARANSMIESGRLDRSADRVRRRRAPAPRRGPR